MSRTPLEMAGGMTFHFVTDGIGPALEQAKAAAGVKDVSLGGGADVVQQYLAAGLLDEIADLSGSCLLRWWRAAVRQSRRAEARASADSGGRGTWSNAQPVRARRGGVTGRGL